MTQSSEDRVDSKEHKGGQVPGPALTDSQVAAYLRANPDFLQRHSDLLDHLTPPEQRSGETVADFQRFMIDRLRREQTVMGAAQKTLIETARANLDAQLRIHNAVLRMIEARSLEHVIAALTTDLAVILDVDVVRLLVESNGEDIPHVHSSGIRVLPPGRVDGWLGTKHLRLSQETPADPELFDQGAPLVGSQALLRLEISEKTPLGLLALGSRDAEQFAPGQGTELLQFLAGAVSRVIGAWLDLPPPQR